MIRVLYNLQSSRVAVHMAAFKTVARAPFYVVISSDGRECCLLQPYELGPGWVEMRVTAP